MLQEISSKLVALKLLQDNVHKDMGSLARTKNLEKSNQDRVKLLGNKTGQCDVLAAQLQETVTAASLPPERSTKLISSTLVLGSSIVRHFDRTARQDHPQSSQYLAEKLQTYIKN